MAEGRWRSRASMSFRNPTTPDISSFSNAKSADDPSRGYVQASFDDNIASSHNTPADRSKLRRGGSKILSIFKLSKTGGEYHVLEVKASLFIAEPGDPTGSENAKVSSTSAAERDEAVAIARNAAAPANDPRTAGRGIWDVGSKTQLIFSPTAVAHPFNSPSVVHLPDQTMLPHTTTPTPLQELRQSPLARPVQRKPLRLIAARSSKSSQALSHRLSHKFSDAFSNPTVVHRPVAPTRPSVRSLKAEADAAEGSRERGLRSLNTQPISTQASVQAISSPRDATSPSSYDNSRTSSSPKGGAREGFTEPTSLMSDLSGKQLSDPKKPSPATLTKAKSMSVLLEDLQETSHSLMSSSPPIVEPSIVTVETTAAAKIFFETYFNDMLSDGVTPRSQRRRDFEHRLHTEPMTPDQRILERRKWSRHESEHLRQFRAIKSRLASRNEENRVAVAGYEVVKILGKGSFGVVRLVRNKDAAQDEMRTSSSDRGASFKEDESRFGTTIGALKSGMHRHRTSRKRLKESMIKQVYAMKVIRKSDMLRNSQEGHLRAERDVLVASAGSRWIVPLIASFQDHSNLYLVMDYMVGGDFLGLLIRRQTLSEEVTRWYVAEMILCVEEAHGLNWIHRDVKPDNFLISASGHLKISDFGLAFDGHWTHDQTYFHHHRHTLLDKLGIAIDGDAIDRKDDRKSAVASSAKHEGEEKHELPQDNSNVRDSEGLLDWRNRTGKRSLAKSVVGTSQYMAPEVVKGELYDGRCDWWSIGVILYEVGRIRAAIRHMRLTFQQCLYGFTPFCTENRHDTKMKIIHHATTLTFAPDPSISQRALNLIESLLQEKEVRLSSKKYALNDYRLSKRRVGRLCAKPADKTAADYQGHYVYAGDAADIKLHPFFRGIHWDRMHLVRPPFVPKVKHWEDTRYFEEDEPISDVEDSSSTYSSAKSRIPSTISNSGTEASGVQTGLQDFALNAAITAPATASHNNNDGAAAAAMASRSHLNSPLDDAETHELQNYISQAMAKAKRKKERKRPRDKILRDEKVGRKVLEMRKDTAFLGYTYRLASHRDNRG
ncbi:MAG: hypothetical protein M1817_002076 [Caeruleum heppii]|nr:MAG: hypothetical protein M1817_002076 [Caeruleum heppii]